MPNVERLSITLPADMAQMIRAKVEGGQYASNSEVIREAIRLWQDREQARAEQLAAIREKIAEADADPRPSLTDEEVERHFARRSEELAGLRRKHG